MCYAPIKIKTNKLQYRNGIDNVFITVPCGKCRECQQSQQSDWFVRIYYEWLKVKKQGGQCFFVTLTLNDAELTRLDTSDPKYFSLDAFLRNYSLGEHFINESGRNDFLQRVDRYEQRYHRSFENRPIVDIPRFDKQSVQNFFKSLRQLFDTDGILPYESDMQIRYFVSSEYGDIKNTFRPHYHCLIFIPFKINENDFLSYCRRAWSHRVCKKDFPDWLSNLVAEKRSLLTKDSKSFVSVVSTPNTKWNDWYIVFDSRSKRFNVFHSYGFANYSKEGATITSIAGCKYLTQYLNYYDTIMRNDFFDMLRDYMKLFPPMKDMFHLPTTLECFKHLNDVFPFKLASQRFGFELYVECGLDGKLGDDEIEFLKRNTIEIPSEKDCYRIPQYLLNRLLFDDDAVRYADKKIRLLSPIGMQVMQAQFEDKISYKIRKYKETIQVLTKFLIPSDFEEWYKGHPAFNGPDDAKRGFWNAIRLGFSDSFRNDAIYDLCYRNVIYSDSGDKMFLDKMSQSDIIDNAIDLMNCKLSSKMHFDFYYETDTYLLNSNGYLANRCFNVLPQFLDVETRITTIEFIRKRVLERDAQHYYDDKKHFSQVRNALNSFIY